MGWWNSFLKITLILALECHVTWLYTLHVTRLLPYIVLLDLSGFFIKLAL